MESVPETGGHFPICRRRSPRWLERTKDPAQIKRLRDWLASGQIELSAAFGSMHTEFMGSEELNRLVSDSSQVERQPETTMTEDRMLRSPIRASAIRLSPYQTLTLRLSVVPQAGAASGEQN